MVNNDFYYLQYEWEMEMTLNNEYTLLCFITFLVASCTDCCIFDKIQSIINHLMIHKPLYIL